MSTAEMTAAPADDRVMRHAGVSDRKNLDDILCDDALNPRTAGYTVEEIEELAASIQGSKGLIQGLTICKSPAAVKEESGKEYTLVAGFRRFAALLKVREDTGDETWCEDVPVMIRDEKDIADLAMIQIIENHQRKPMNPMDLGNAIVRAIQAYGMSKVEFAKKAGMTKGAVTQYAKLATLPDTIKAMIENDMLAFGQARDLLRLPEDQWEKAAGLATGMSGDAFTDYVNKLLGKTATPTDEKGADGTQAADGATAKEAEAAQKTVHSMRVVTIEKEYVPYLKEQIALATDDGLKKSLSDKMDALLWVVHGQKAGDTELAKFLAAYEEAKAAKIAEDKANSESIKACKEYVTSCIKHIRQTLDPSQYGEDKAAGRVIPELASVLKSINDKFEADLTLVGDKFIGFTLPITVTYTQGEKEEETTIGTAIDMVRFVHDRYIKDRDSRKAAAQLRKETKAREAKEAADKAEKDKEAAAAVAAAPDTEAADGATATE